MHALKPRQQKLLILFIIQLGFYHLVLLMGRGIARMIFSDENAFPVRMYVVLFILFFIYFFQLWRSVYSRNYHYYLGNVQGIVLRNAALPILSAIVAYFILGGENTLPLHLALFYIALTVLSFPLAHQCQFIWLRYLYHLGYFKKNLISIGGPNGSAAAYQYIRALGRTKRYIGEVYEWNGGWKWRSESGKDSHYIHGTEEVLSLILKKNVGDIVLFHGNSGERGLMQKVTEYCETLGIGFSYVPRAIPKSPIKELIFPYVPTIERYAGSRDSLTEVSAKRLLDIFVSALCIALFIPFGILIALSIILSDGGPAFYISTRIGKNGAPIRFYKFRTMRVSAEQEKKALMPYNERSDGPLFKMRNDPRVTRIGRILRRNNIDEIPQLLNVLVGNMSLVGPRPHLPEEVCQYRDAEYLRLECMPGIVGLPQIIGPNTMCFKKSVKLDLLYRRNWSFAGDINILLKTLKMFVIGLFPRSRGA